MCSTSSIFLDVEGRAILALSLPSEILSEQDDAIRSQKKHDVICISTT